jgi:tRNA (cmo5U34)-methyltransferase
MIARASDLLGPYEDRVILSQHNIHEADYLSRVVPGPVGVITSSLAIHHCSDEEKAALYRDAFQKLTSPGALVVIDVTKPASEPGVKANKEYWQSCIRQQSLRLTGSEQEYEKFKHVPGAFYEQPAEEDQPATLADNLRLLAEAGFKGIDCFWKKCGFTIFGGHK